MGSKNFLIFKKKYSKEERIELKASCNGKTQIGQFAQRCFFAILKKHKEHGEDKCEVSNVSSYHDVCKRCRGNCYNGNLEKL